MMKRNLLAVVIPALLVAGTANAAEVFNKDSNKLDLYGKMVGLHYFSDNDATTATRAMRVLASRAKQKLTIT